MMHFFSKTFELAEFSFTAIWDEKGRLWHLCFGGKPGLHFLKRLRKICPVEDFDTPPEGFTEGLKEELSLYLEGKHKKPRYPVFLLGTKFEKEVWQTLLEIPYGEVRTYSWLAQKIGKPKACRAVGGALARNPLPIFFPCHRIVSEKGLGGFSAGLQVKKKLLSLEGALSID